MDTGEASVYKRVNEWITGEASVYGGGVWIL